MNRPEHRPEYNAEDMQLIRRRNAENWLTFNKGWLEKLRGGTESCHLGEKATASLRKRLNAGVEYGVLIMYGSHSNCAWELTEYAEVLIEELNLWNDQK